MDLMLKASVLRLERRNMRAVFSRKEPEIVANEFKVEKVIVLPENDYLYFAENLMKQYDFIEKNVELMYEQSGVWHCVLVTGDGTDEGILVESEGSAYARYSAFVPSISDIMQQLEETCEVDKTEIGQKESDQMIRM